jgi:hypothetical protein
MRLTPPRLSGLIVASSRDSPCTRATVDEPAAACQLLQGDRARQLGLSRKS